jgi:hypothetical protein
MKEHQKEHQNNIKSIENTIKILTGTREQLKHQFPYFGYRKKFYKQISKL